MNKTNRIYSKEKNKSYSYINTENFIKDKTKTKNCYFISKTKIKYKFL